MALLVLKNINKFYGAYKANDNITFEVDAGSVFGLLGPNGAGKTTLIRIITNIIAADSGEITIDGEKFKNAHHEMIGYMPEERGLYKKMKVGEHLVYLARLKNLSKKDANDKIHYWMDKFGIADWWNKKIEELSKGMQQKIQFIATVIHDPKLLILDEPFSGLDPINTSLIKDEIFELKEKGTAIIFSTHRMEQVEEICEQMVLINEGKNILAGSVHEIKQQFKENKYSINYSGELPPNMDGLIVVDNYDHEVVIKLKDGQSSNDALRFCIQNNMEIKSFNEILPSINDIFISQVSK